MGNYLDDANYHVCAICGKKIYTRLYNMKEWAYQRAGVFACSYTCQTELLNKSNSELKRLKGKNKS